MCPLLHLEYLNRYLKINHVLQLFFKVGTLDNPKIMENIVQYWQAVTILFGMI